jgi:integrase/recombinase XerD
MTATARAPRQTRTELRGPNPVETLVEDYLTSCRARGLSRATIEQAYSYSLKQVFLPWCRDQAITEPAALTQRELDRFTATLLETGGRRGPLSKHTVHSYVRAVRQLLAWAQKEGEVGAARPQLPRLPRRLVETLSRDEIDRLEAAAENPRDRLIVRLLADTGIRVSELCGLMSGDVLHHERRSLLRIHGKGDKERLVPLTPPFARQLERFVRELPDDGDRAVFRASRRGPDGRYGRLTRSGVLQLLRSLAYRAGITRRVHPHLFRHSFATEALRRGMNPLQLADVLGHNGLRMIESVYAHLTVDDAYDAVMQMLLPRHSPN